MPIFAEIRTMTRRAHKNAKTAPKQLRTKRIRRMTKLLNLLNRQFVTESEVNKFNNWLQRRRFGELHIEIVDSADLLAANSKPRLVHRRGTGAENIVWQTSLLALNYIDFICRQPETDRTVLLPAINLPDGLPFSDRSRYFILVLQKQELNIVSPAVDTPTDAEDHE